MTPGCDYCKKPFEHDPDLDRHRCFSVSWGDFCGSDCATEARRESNDKRLESTNQNVLTPKVPTVPGDDGAQERPVRDVQDNHVQGVSKGSRRRSARNKGVQGVQEGAAQAGVEALEGDANV